jgi:hypothetical protein
MGQLQIGSGALALGAKIGKEVHFSPSTVYKLGNGLITGRDPRNSTFAVILLSKSLSFSSSIDPDISLIGDAIAL